MAQLARQWFATVLIVAAAAPLGAQGVGVVAFANSGAAAAQPAFLRGLALLHNFEYDDAAESFRKAQELDPGFAMAYWGEAMTHTHPIWMQQDRDAALAVLQRLAPAAEARAAKAPSARERDWLRTVEVLYGEGSKEERDRAFAAALAALHEKYPDDVDAAAFYGLALLGTAHEGRDFATYMRAAAVLEEAYAKQPRHPGVLHYLIHSYDDAVHAPLGVRAARLYGAVAPDAPHALHMTSHIFIALGQWDDVIAANRQASEVVNHQRAAKGQPPKRCGHYPEWLFYGYLQTGRRADADRSLEECRQEVLEEIAKPAPAPAEGAAHHAMTMPTSAESWAHMRLQYLVDTGELPAQSVAVPADARFGWARFHLAYGDLYAAARRGDGERAREASARLAEAERELGALRQRVADAVQQKTVAAVMRQAEALVKLAEGKRAEALELLVKAAEAEEAIPLVFGPPVVEKPSRELLAEELLAAGRAADARQAVEAALARTPGRTSALRTLLAAQKALGESQAAARTEAAIARNMAREGAAAGASR